MSPSAPPGECIDQGRRVYCRHLPCRPPSHPTRILVCLTQDLSTANHPKSPDNNIAMSNTERLCAKYLHVEVPRRIDFCHHDVHEVSPLIARQPIHPFHLWQSRPPHHLRQEPSDLKKKNVNIMHFCKPISYDNMRFLAEAN